MSITKLEQSHIDLSKLKPLNPNRLVAFVNHMVIRITKELNELVLNVDTRLEQLHVKISQCEANLTILETKLNSIPGLSYNLTANPTITIPAESANVTVTNHIMANVEAKIDVANDDSQMKSETTATGESPEENVEETKPEKDPRLAKYYKMLQVGVPLPAVHQKMIGEDLDPNLLIL